MFLPHGSSSETDDQPHIVSERRAEDRIQSVYKVAKVVRDDDCGLWRIQNLSNRGLMFSTAQAVEIGEHLTIFLSDKIVVRGKVLWSTGEACGVEFDRPIDCEAVMKCLAEERTDGAYRAPRLTLGCRAIAYGESGIHPLKVLDVSLQGVGLRHDGWLRPGMKIRLILEGGSERACVVMWSAGDRAGARLLDLFSCAELESIRTLSPAMH